MSFLVGRKLEKHRRMSKGEWDNVNSGARAGLLSLLL